MRRQWISSLVRNLKLVLFQEIRQCLDVVQWKSSIKHHPESVLRNMAHFKWDVSEKVKILILVTSWGFQAQCYGHTRCAIQGRSLLLLLHTHDHWPCPKRCPWWHWLGSCSFSKLMHTVVRDLNTFFLWEIVKNTPRTCIQTLSLSTLPSTDDWWSKFLLKSSK